MNSVSSLYISFFNILVEMKMMKLQNRDQTLKQTGASAEDSADVTFLV